MLRYYTKIINTCDMTITPVEGVYQGKFRIELPDKSYNALRLKKLTNAPE